MLLSTNSNHRIPSWLSSKTLIKYKSLKYSFTKKPTPRDPVLAFASIDLLLFPYQTKPEILNTLRPVKGVSLMPNISKYKCFIHCCLR